MIRRGLTMFACIALSSCASKTMKTSLTTLETDNKALRADVAKLQTEVRDLSNDLLVVQNRVQNSPMRPMIATPVAVVEKPVYAAEPKKMYRQESFLGDDIQFSDDETSASASSMKFTNRDLTKGPLQIVPGSGNSKTPVTTKSKSGAFTETTLVENNSNEKSVASATPVATPAASGSNIEDPAIVAAYNRGYKMFKDQNYRETIQLMSDFLKQYPNHQYSDNAIFWMGESYYQLKNYEQANAEFEKVVTRYPNGNKVPDALLRQGICMLKLSKPEKAKGSFDHLIKKYPESVAAKKAKTTLGEL